MQSKMWMVSLALAQLMMADNLLQNGSFEEFSSSIDRYGYTSAAHWRGIVEIQSNRTGRPATDGYYKMELDTKRDIVDEISQDVRTVAGTRFLLSFDAYGRKEGSSDIEILVDGELLATITPTKRWRKYGVQFTGTGSTQTITLREVSAQNDGVGAVLDHLELRSDVIELDDLKEKERARYEILEPTGIDQIAAIIDDDNRVRAKVSKEDIQNAKAAALEMNGIVKEGIEALGLLNDGTFTPSDAMELASYIKTRYGARWLDLRQKYEKIEKYGEIKALNKNAIRNVWGKIYNLGFGNHKNRYLLDRKGKKSIHFSSLAYMMQSVIADENLSNPEYEEVHGTTATSLDKIAKVILNDRGLNERNPKGNLRKAVGYADRMNALILEAIRSEGLVNDGRLTPADVRTINRYLVERYAQEWVRLHGDDEKGYESGYHLVQNNGATTRMYGRNVMNTIADGIYHLGFETDNPHRLKNEDGKPNQTFEDVAWWLDMNLKEDYAKLQNPNYKEPVGTTGTSFDRIIEYIYADQGLSRKVSMDDIRVAARAADRMNHLIIEAIKETGAAEDRYFSVEDIKAINSYLVANYAGEWVRLHGDDEEGYETGFHRIQNDGAVMRLEGKNLINNLIDGIYHLGFYTQYDNRLVNEDGNKNATFYSVAYWLNKYLQEDLHTGKLVK